MAASPQCDIEGEVPRGAPRSSLSQGCVGGRLGRRAVTGQLGVSCRGAGNGKTPRSAPGRRGLGGVKEEKQAPELGSAAWLCDLRGREDGRAAGWRRLRDRLL